MNLVWKKSTQICSHCSVVMKKRAYDTFYIHASVRIFTLIKRQGRHVDDDGNINNLEQKIHNRFSTNKTKSSGTMNIALNMLKQ